MPMLSLLMLRKGKQSTKFLFHNLLPPSQLQTLNNFMFPLHVAKLERTFTRMTKKSFCAMPRKWGIANQQWNLLMKTEDLLDLSIQKSRQSYERSRRDNHRKKINQ